ncbi:hypothetical protein [Xenorhabdus bovienii]|uniref:hypothetical protein n=1 Tax=Xenorhabdus bovienii TaxID=40576 RepID=UPI003DA3555A
MFKVSDTEFFHLKPQCVNDVIYAGEDEVGNDYIDIHVKKNEYCLGKLDQLLRSNIGAVLTIYFSERKIVSATIQSAIGEEFRITVPDRLTGIRIRDSLLGVRF